MSQSQCGVTLSGRLPVTALVSRYLTNKLIGPGPLLMRQVPKDPRLSPSGHAASWLHSVLAAVSSCYPQHEGRLSRHYSPLRHSTQAPKGPFSFDLHA